MPATGDEVVKLSQLKEWSNSGGGGGSPATSEVTISNSSGNDKIVRFMGVDGSYQQQISTSSMTTINVPIMSNIYCGSKVGVRGGIIIYYSDGMGHYQTIICVTEPTCSITLISY